MIVQVENLSDSGFLSHPAPLLAHNAAADVLDLTSSYGNYEKS